MRHERLRRRSELERLRAWKAEALQVLGWWHEVAARVPAEWMPLGQSEALSTGRYIDHLQNEEARLAGYIVYLQDENARLAEQNAKAL